MSVSTLRFGVNFFWGRLALTFGGLLATLSAAVAFSGVGVMVASLEEEEGRLLPEAFRGPRGLLLFRG